MSSRILHLPGALLVMAAVLPAASPQSARLRLFEWERGIAFESPARPDMRMYLRFYEWNMFEARGRGQHTNGNDRLPRSVTADRMQGQAGTEDLLLKVSAGSDSADLTLSVANRTDYDWPGGKRPRKCPPQKMG